MLWRFHEAGDPTAPATVLLHGWLGHGQAWLPLLQDLPRRHRWIIPDLPGHHGPLKTTPSWSFPEVTDELIAQLRGTYGLSQWHLVGYSMGGRLALYTAIHYPEAIHGLLLESCQPGITAQTARTARASLDDQRAQDLQTRGLEAFVHDWYQAPLFASLQAQPALLARLTSARLRHDPQGVAAALSHLSPGRQPDLWPRLSELTMPVTLLTGLLDEKYTGLMGQMATLIKDVQLTVQPDAGHNVHAERPDVWCQQLQALYTRS